MTVTDLAQRLPRFAFLANAHSLATAAPRRPADVAGKTGYPPFVEPQKPSASAARILKFYGANGPFPNSGPARPSAYPPFVCDQQAAPSKATKRGKSTAETKAAEAIKSPPTPLTVRASAFPPFVGAESRQSEVGPSEGATALKKLNSRKSKAQPNPSAGAANEPAARNEVFLPSKASPRSEAREVSQHGNKPAADQILAAEKSKSVPEPLGPKFVTTTSKPDSKVRQVAPDPAPVAHVDQSNANATKTDSPRSHVGPASALLATKATKFVDASHVAPKADLVPPRSGPSDPVQAVPEPLGPKFVDITSVPDSKVRPVESRPKAVAHDQSTANVTRAEKPTSHVGPKAPVPPATKADSPTAHVGPEAPVPSATKATKVVDPPASHVAPKADLVPPRSGPSDQVQAVPEPLGPKFVDITSVPDSKARPVAPEPTAIARDQSTAKVTRADTPTSHVGPKTPVPPAAKADSPTAHVGPKAPVPPATKADSPTAHVGPKAPVPPATKVTEFVDPPASHVAPKADLVAPRSGPRDQVQAVPEPLGPVDATPKPDSKVISVESRPTAIVHDQSTAKVTRADTPTSQVGPKMHVSPATKADEPTSHVGPKTPVLPVAKTDSPTVHVGPKAPAPSATKVTKVVDPPASHVAPKADLVPPRSGPSDPVQAVPEPLGPKFVDITSVPDSKVRPVAPEPTAIAHDQSTAKVTRADEPTSHVGPKAPAPPSAKADTPTSHVGPKTPVPPVAKADSPTVHVGPKAPAPSATKVTKVVDPPASHVAPKPDLVPPRSGPSDPVQAVPEPLGPKFVDITSVPDSKARPVAPEPTAIAHDQSTAKVTRADEPTSHVGPKAPAPPVAKADTPTSHVGPKTPVPPVAKTDSPTVHVGPKAPVPSATKATKVVDPPASHVAPKADLVPPRSGPSDQVQAVPEPLGPKFVDTTPKPESKVMPVESRPTAVAHVAQNNAKATKADEPTSHAGPQAPVLPATKTDSPTSHVGPKADLVAPPSGPSDQVQAVPQPLGPKIVDTTPKPDSKVRPVESKPTAVAHVAQNNAKATKADEPTSHAGPQAPVSPSAKADSPTSHVGPKADLVAPPSGPSDQVQAVPEPLGPKIVDTTPKPDSKVRPAEPNPGPAPVVQNLSTSSVAVPSPTAPPAVLPVGAGSSTLTSPVWDQAVLATPTLPKPDATNPASRSQARPNEFKPQASPHTSLASGFLVTHSKSPEPQIAVPEVHLGAVPVAIPVVSMKGSSPSSLASQREGPPEKSAGSSSPPERIAPPDIDRPREAGTNVQARAKDGAEAKPEAKLAINAEARPEAKLEIKAEAKPEAKLEIKAEARPEAKLEIKAEARPEAKLEIKAEARPEAKLEIKAEARPEAKLEIKAEARPEAKLEIKAEARPEAKLEIKAEARPEAKLEIKGVSEAEGDKKVGSHQISPREKSDESPPVPPQSRIDAKSSVASTEQPAPTLSRLQAERALAKDDSVLVLRASQKPAVTDQTLFTSSKRKQPEESNVFGAASHRPKRSGALNRERVVWLKEKGLVAPGKGNFRQQVLTAEERVVHKALVTLVPHEAQLTGVRIATSSSKVHAQIETLDGETLDPRQIQKLRQDFERQTGRQLVLEKPQEAKANEMPGLGASPAPRPPAPAPNKSTTKPAVIQEPPPLDVRRTAARRDDGKEATPQPPSKPVSPAKFRHVSYAVAGAEAAGAAAAAAAHGAAVLALNPLVVVDPKIGTLAGLHQIENRWSAAPSTGGASRPRFYQPPQPETEDDIDPRSQQQSEENQKSTGATESKGKGRIHSQEPSDRLVHAQRLGLDETSDHENHDQSGGRGGKSSCRGCGTELPESQRDACPVCAQSGPDVIAMTSVNYRFAGSKFLAAADSVAASSQARGMLDQGMTESVVSLRYKPKIPGHKDLLRFRAT